MKRFSTKLLLALFALLFYCGSAMAKNEVKELVCEYHTNPLGIDIKQPRLSWQLVSDSRNVIQTAYEIQVKDGSPNGRVLWSTGKVNSGQSVDIVYEGAELKSMQRVYWQVRVWDNNGKQTAWSKPAWWEMGIMEAESWKASWISVPDNISSLEVRPCPYFRKEFPSDKKVKSARIYITSLGLYQLYLNGEKVSTDLFTPGWTSYNKRLQYQVYDVTEKLQAENAIGAVLGDGWYSGKIAWQGGKEYYGDKLALLCQLNIEYTDGTSQVICSDQSWKTGIGPIVGSDIYDGETYDATMEIPGWVSPRFDDTKWQPVALIDHTKETLVASQGEVVRICQEIKPVKIITTPKGEKVFDMGQNMVGWVQLNINGIKGDTVILKFAEVLDKDGNFYTTNLRAAKSTDTYILKGNGQETYEPHFTFHGFRYVQLIGSNGELTPDMITGKVIHSDMKLTGSFTCSNPLINQLQHNIQWGQRGNFLDIPTDCPQRDERLGWTGDAQVFSMTAAYNFNVAAFYTKWLRDLSADQLPNGSVPHVIPDALNHAGGSTAWGDVAVILPWSVYLTYGDKRILEVQYPSMKAWVEYMRSRAGDDNLWEGDFHFGDWLAFATTRSDYPGATTEKDLIATAYYAYSSGILSKVAAIIGNENEATEYSDLSEKIKKAFIKEYVTSNGRLVSHTQTAYSLALMFGLLPEELVSKAAAYLAGDVKKFGHLTTGFVGTPLLCQALSDNGYADLAFMLLNREKYPSWLYPVKQGATTIWERWDGQKPDGTFQDVGMNSFNHYAYGAIGEWLYTYVAGLNIDPQNPGYKHIIFRPHVGGGLTNANAEFISLYGMIKSGWSVEGKDFVYSITVPANTTATVVLPCSDPYRVSMNQTVLDKSIVSITGEGVVTNVGSGEYQFRCTGFIE